MVGCRLLELLRERKVVVWVLELVVPYLIAKGMRRILHPVRPGFETRAVVHPIELDTGLMAKILQLPVERLLLAVTAIEGVDIGEELLGVRLLHFPRRIADDSVKAWSLTLEDIREFQLPVEEAMYAPHIASSTGSWNFRMFFKVRLQA